MSFEKISFDAVLDDMEMVAVNGGIVASNGNCSGNYCCSGGGSCEGNHCCEAVDKLNDCME